MCRITMINNNHDNNVREERPGQSHEPEETKWHKRLCKLQRNRLLLMQTVFISVFISLHQSASESSSVSISLPQSSLVSSSASSSVFISVFVSLHQNKQVDSQTAGALSSYENLTVPQIKAQKVLHPPAVIDERKQLQFRVQSVSLQTLLVWCPAGPSDLWNRPRVCSCSIWSN